MVSNEASVDAVNEVLTMHMGPEYILVNISLDFSDDLPAGEIEKIVASLDSEIKTKYDKVKRIFIEARSATEEKRRTV